MALVGISTIEEYVKLWFFGILKENFLQVLWSEQIRIPCQSYISLHNNLVKMFFLYNILSTSMKDMQGLTVMQSTLKKLYSYLLLNFKSKCGSWFYS